MNKESLKKYEITEIGISYVTEFNRWISKTIQKWDFITPNLLTFLSFVLSVLAAFFFLIPAVKGLLCSAVLILLSYLLDYTDGEIARLKRMETNFGFWFDRITDQIKLTLLLLALGLRAYYIEGANVNILIVAAVAIMIQLIKEFNWALFEIFRLMVNSQTAYAQLMLDNININFSKNTFVKRIIFYLFRILAFMQYEQFIILAISPLLIKARGTLFIYGTMSLFAFIGRTTVYMRIYFRKDAEIKRKEEEKK